MQTRWSDGELDVIRRMWAEGHSGAHIANTLGEAGFNRSRSAVLGIVHRSGFKRDRVPVPEPKPVAPVAERKVKEPKVAKEAARKRSPKDVGRDVAIMKTLASPSRGLLPKKPPPAEPEPEVVPAPAPRPLAPAGGVALVDLEHWHCRRIVAEQPYRFCGREKAFGTSWCSACCERVFTPEGMERMRVGRKPPQRVKAAA